MIINRIAICVILASALTLSVAPQPPHHQFLDSEFMAEEDPIEQNIIQNDEMAQSKRQEQQLQKSMPAHLVAEFSQVTDFQGEFELEMFEFELQEQFQIKWTILTPGKYAFRVVVLLFDGTDITLPDMPGQEEYVDVIGIFSETQQIKEFGKVYLSKIFTVTTSQPSSSYRLVFINHCTSKHKILIDVELEKSGMSLASGIIDDKFSLSAEKMRAILVELEQTQKHHRKLFLEEYSVLGRQERNESEMLVLTGVELLVIVGTAIILMYCMKNLIDDRIVV